jgi:phosphoglycerate dehydrogenase-like enzyme
VTKVLVVLDPNDPAAAPLRASLATVAGVDVRFAAGDEAIDAAVDVDAIVCDEAGDALLAAAPRLRWVAFWGAGLDDRYTRALQARRDVVVTNASGVHGPNIAEHVMGLILTFTRRLHEYARAQAARDYRQPESYTSGVDELAGKTLGIIGLGRIGEAIAARARPFEVRVVAVKRDPSRRHDPSIAVDELWGMDGLDRLLGESDHVVVTLPLTAETRGVLGADRLGCMKPTAYLYNVGRGAVVDEDALVRALASGAIAGAGLDVFAREPLPRDSALWGMPNVLVTPHVSGLTPRYFERVARLVADNARRFVAAEPLVNVFDPDRGY